MAHSHEHHHEHHHGHHHGHVGKLKSLNGIFVFSIALNLLYVVVKAHIKHTLPEANISHSTLEFETPGGHCHDHECDTC